MRGARIGAAVGLAAGSLILLGGCFFVRAPVPEGSALGLGPLVGGVGQEVEIPVEVLGFPEPGVAGVAVLALGYDPNVLELRDIVGKNGFVVLCSCVDNVRGQAKFVALHPGGGLTAGTVAVLRGVRLRAGDPRWTLSPRDTQLIDAAHQGLSGYAIHLGGAPLYSARRP
ncbi:MAG: hypothetical protein ABDI20_05960 [Candidatus Bipolaricaulaceae bacterium]